MKRTCLIIDDEDQTEEIEKLVRDAKHQGIELTCFQFNVGNTGCTEFLSDGLIDIDKVVSQFNNQYRNFHFDIIAFDWHLDDENVTGVELIRKFAYYRLARFSPKIVYSGVLDDVIKKIIGPK